MELVTIQIKNSLPAGIQQNIYGTSVYVSDFWNDGWCGENREGSK